MRRKQSQSGQALAIVAVWLVALIGSAALILLTGSVEWQRNQLQQIADQAALDSAMKIGVGCSAGSAATVISEADGFIATQRSRTGSLSIGAGSCAAGYTGTDSFSSGVTATIVYPYRAHQQQVAVTLTEALPISFGSYLGATNTNVTRRAVAQELNGSTAAVTATTLSCTGGQFDIAGSVVTSNTISLSGGCAVYAHDRFDVTSGTYSDLGNTSVYASGQTWVGGGGHCTAGALSGSATAVCADGFELSGHASMTCGTSAVSAYLAPGDAAINPNPCVAGTGTQPVTPVGSALPPEPNADPTITATLPGGVACSPGASYGNITVNGVTVGTGNAAAPSQDAAGYVHFKTGCYGYLDLTSMKPVIAHVQSGPEAARKKNPTLTLPAPSTAGDLLVAAVNADPTSNPFTAPAGWVFAVAVNQATAGREEIWYYPNNPGGISGAVFTTGVNAVGQLTEWSGVVASSPLDQTGTFATGTTSTSATISTSAATTAANELVITNNSFKIGPGQTYTPNASWNSLVNDAGNGFGTEYRLDLPAAVASESVSTSQATTWSMAIASFKATGGAVLDPGFYYFNGSGFAGGGGICLNGGTLLARDVTLEFVNSAGFSSGTCAAGGGAACTSASCAFGSVPCSISACPPNAAADSASGGYEWFSAPCSQAPAGDGGCSGSAWCPSGDRACWNLLMWAPSTVTGQVAITGTAAKAWLLGSVYFPGTCTYAANGGSMIAGTVSCVTLSVSAAAAQGTAVGGDYGISTALVEAVLVE